MKTSNFLIISPYLITILVNFFKLNGALTNGKPYIDQYTPEVVITKSGGYTFLLCRIKNLTNQTVSWIRSRDLSVLTKNCSIFTTDERIGCIHSNDSEDWILIISDVQLEDIGEYQCQINAEPLINHRIFLLVTGPKTSIIGQSEIFINAGSIINITCVIENGSEKLQRVDWSYNNQKIKYELSHNRIFIMTYTCNVTVSHLFILNATISDSGRYTCQPIKAPSKSVIIHVFSDAQHRSTTQIIYSLIIIWILLFILILI